MYASKNKTKTDLRTGLCTKCYEGQKEEKLNEGKQLHPSPQQDAGSDKSLREAHPESFWSTEHGEMGSPPYRKGILRASWRDSLVPYLWRSYHMSLVAQMVKRLSTMQETWVRSLVWEDSLEKEMATHSSTHA